MKNHFIVVLFFLLMVMVKCQPPGPQTYYVDSKNGNDGNPGTSAAKAWASLEKLNQVTFKPGDKILFRSGTVYKGQFRPQGSGAEGAPITVSRYEEGAKPRIDGEGKYLATVLLHNVEYWELNDLEITNTGSERAGGRTGVMVQAENFGDCHHIYLNGLDVHDVNGSLVKNEGGGSAIHWKNTGDSVMTRFIDLRIENCHLYRCERNAIISDGNIRRDRWHPSLGVVIRNNLLEQIPGDGIVPIGCDGALIEHNIMRDSPDILSHEEAAAGIWPWSSDNTLIQYNEVSGHRAKWDGQGFDADWNCRNTIIQYNYSHDNAGGFLLICNNGENINSNINIGTEGTIVRYNVSVNDGLRPYATERAGIFSPTFHITGPCKNTQIYNNIIYVPAKPDKNIDNTIIRMDNWGGPWPENTVFSNNIFYAVGDAKFEWGKSLENLFSHNVFYGRFANLPDDKHALYSDPMFARALPPGSSGLESLAAFKLQASSPCIGSGIPIKADSLVDVFGNIVNPAKVNRGVDQSQY